MLSNVRRETDLAATSPKTDPNSSESADPQNKNGEFVQVMASLLGLPDLLKGPGQLDARQQEALRKKALRQFGNQQDKCVEKIMGLATQKAVAAEGASRLKILMTTKDELQQAGYDRPAIEEAQGLKASPCSIRTMPSQGVLDPIRMVLCPTLARSHRSDRGGAQRKQTYGTMSKPASTKSKRRSRIGSRTSRGWTQRTCKSAKPPRRLASRQPKARKAKADSQFEVLAKSRALRRASREQSNKRPTGRQLGATTM